jgi:hypothetical protein
MRFPIVFLLCISFAVGFFPTENKIKPEKGFPIWLKDGSLRTDQTSGIAFIGSKASEKYFLLCDDIGDIFHLRLNNNKIKLEKIKLGEMVKKALRNYDKWDFEEIVYDPSTKKVFLSIEGNGSNYLDEAELFNLVFKDNDVFEDEIKEIVRVEFPEWKKLSEHFKPNIAFEGVAVSENKIFLGLEGTTLGELFLDSTFLYVVDKNSLNIVRQISTKKLKIHTISGLYAESDFKLFGIDRNNRNLFVINFDEKYEIIESKILPLDLHVPSDENLHYVSALESITMDNEKYIYAVDDPWKKFYIPPTEVLRRIKPSDAQNFKEFIPLLFKFNSNKVR